VVDHWTLYRSFTFDSGRAEIRGADKTQVSEIAAYMAQNPSLRLGLDGATDPGVTDPHNQQLGDRRVAAVRDALIRAGTPANKIATGAFGDPQLKRDRQVDVLLITAR
jgi:outer membrane protein OmpA-like peptidoglycan-associated protein